MVLLLELTFPALALDDSLARRDARGRGAARAWDDAAFEALSSGSVLLVQNRDLYTRAIASRATGELRGDLSLVPMFDVAGPASLREVARDVHLEPLWRDLVLEGTPREWALSRVSGGRPVAHAFDPGEDRALLRHVLPRGLLATFEPEPRGMSERLHALDATLAEQAQLEEEIGDGKDPRLAALTARLLEDRAALSSSLEETGAVVRALGGHARGLAPPTAALDRLGQRGTASRASRLVPMWP